MSGRILVVILSLLMIAVGVGSACERTTSGKKAPEKKISPEEAEVRQAVERYISAVKDGKINLMWSMLSTGLKEQMAEDGIDKAEFTRRAEHEIDQTNKLQGAITKINFSKVKVAGAEAKVEFSLVREAGTVPKKYTLKKVSNRWRLDNLRE